MTHQDRLFLTYKVTEREAGLLQVAAHFGNYPSVPDYARKAIQDFRPERIQINKLGQLPPDRRSLPEAIEIQLDALSTDSVNQRHYIWITDEDDVLRMEELARKYFNGNLSAFIRHAILRQLERDGWSP